MFLRPRQCKNVILKMTFLQSKQSVKMSGEQLNELSVSKDIKIG